MGEIRKDNLHESLIEELNELANIDLSGKQDKTDESLLTESKDLVGAINELFQSANNGKELIANAIGEPVSAEDTFSAMSNDINSLLSTFKTNMMNNGITVESGDKFKQLIDKIATMVEEGSGKGIQYVEGTIDPAELTSVKSFNYIEGTNVKQGDYKYLDLNYFNNSNMVIIHSIVEFLTGTDEFYMVYLCSNCVCVSKSIDYNTSNGVYFNNITTDIPVVPHNQYSTIHECSYYYVGVGEEDTTLRDSLASILQEEGVSVTEEDDMASLIGKVDEEFTKDNNTINTLNTEKTNLTNQVDSLNTNITLLTNQVNSLTSELAGKVTPAGTAVAGDVLSGKTFINSTGKTVTGTMTNMSTHTQVADYVAWDTDSVYLGIPKGAYVNASSTGYPEVYIKKTRLDSNLVAANIVSGKSICGVAGSASKLPTAVAGTNVELGYIVTIMSYFSSSGYHKCFSCKPNVIGTVTVSCSSSTSNAIGYIYHKKNGSTVQSVNITSGSFSVNIGNIDGNSIIEYHRYGNTSDSLSHLKVSCNYS